jgi:hypothetical protein
LGDFTACWVVCVHPFKTSCSPEQVQGLFKNLIITSWPGKSLFYGIHGFMATKTGSSGHDAMYGRWLSEFRRNPSFFIFKIESTYQTNCCHTPPVCNFNVVKFTAVRTFDFALLIGIFTKAIYWM